MVARNFKPLLLKLLAPLTGALVRGGIPPTALTFAGLGVSGAAAVAFAFGPLAAAGVLLLVAGLFDVLDGAVARAGGRLTRSGAFLDSNVDRFAEIAVFVGILGRFRAEPPVGLAVLLAATGSLMVSYSKARAEGLGQQVVGGLLQRPERVLLLAAGAFLGEEGLRIVLWGLALLAYLTSLHRMLLVTGSLVRGGEAPQRARRGRGNPTAEGEPAARGSIEPPAAERDEAEPAPPPA